MLSATDLGGAKAGGDSKLVFTILSAVADAERDRSRVPWGYRVGEAGELISIPAMQAALRWMQAMRAEGLALRAITNHMKAPACPSAMPGSETPSLPLLARRSRRVWIRMPET